MRIIISTLTMLFTFVSLEGQHAKKIEYNTLEKLLNEVPASIQDTLFIALISPRDCHKFNLILKDISESYLNNKHNKTLYLVHRIRKKELPHFTSSQLNFLENFHQVATYDKLYDYINPLGSSSFAVYIKGQPADTSSSSFKIMPLGQAKQFLSNNIQKNTEYMLQYKGAVMIDESAHVLSKKTKFMAYQANELIGVDLQYGKAYIIDGTNGKITETFSITESDYFNTFQQHFEADSTYLKLVKLHKPELRKHNIPDYKFNGATLHEDTLYILMTFTFFRDHLPDSLDDDSEVHLMFYPFLLKYILTSKKKLFYSITTQDDSPFRLNSNLSAFYYDKEADVFCFQGKTSSSKDNYPDKLPFLGIWKEGKQHQQLDFVRTHDATLPSFFIEKKLGYNLAQVKQFIRYKKNWYFHFGHLPFLYALDTTIAPIALLPDSLLKDHPVNSGPNWYSAKFGFKIKHVTRIKEENICYIYWENNGADKFESKFTIYNSAETKHHKFDITKYIPDFIDVSYVVNDSLFYAICYTDDAIWVKKFNYRL